MTRNWWYEWGLHIYLIAGIAIMAAVWIYGAWRLLTG